MKTAKFLATILTVATMTVVGQPTKTSAQTDAQTGMCRFNATVVMECTLTNSGGTFSIAWNDGVSDTYHWIGANADRVNIRDSRGGNWHYSDYRNCRDFDLTNVNNGNVITFTGHHASC